MAINQDIISTSWEGQQKSYIEAGLKTLLQRMLEVLESPLAANSVGSNQLTQELRDLINSIDSKVPNNRTVNNKPLSADVTIGPDDIMVGNQTLADKLDEMDDAIGQGGDTSGLASRITALETSLNRLTGTEDTTQIIDTFNEVIDFLANVNNDETLLGKLQQLQTQINSKANDNAVVKSISVNGTQQSKDQQGNVNIDAYTKAQTEAKIAEAVDGIEAGETVVINSDGANIVDEHDNNSVLLAPSARQMKLMYNNIMAIYNGLANIAFTNGKPTLDWIGSKTKYTLSYGTMTGCTADVAAGQVNEGALRIKLTPTQASYAFTSVTVNGESASTTATGDADGSVYLDIIVNGNITVAATAISGRAVNFNGGDGATIGAAGVAIGQDLDTTITANEHFTLPSSITVKIGNTNVAHTYTRAQDNKTATLHIDAANITGDLTITCTAVEDAHVTLVISGSNFVVKQGSTELSNGSKVYNGSAAQTLTIEPASGYKFSTLPSADKGTMTNNGPYEASSLEIGTSVSGTLTITAAGAALETFSIDLDDVTSDVGVAWNTPSAAVSTILEGSPFSVTLTKVGGTGVLNIGTCTMENGTLQPSSGTIATDHVTGNITIAASVAAAQMKVHSWDWTKVSGSADNKPRYREDGVDGQFRLYYVSDVNSLSPSWSPSGGSYPSGYANGISDNYTAGYGRRTLNVGTGDFTIALRGVAIAVDNGQSVAYGNKQLRIQFYDSTGVNNVNNGQAQFGTRQFAFYMRQKSSTGALVNSESMYPYIEYVNNGQREGLVGSSAGVPVTIPANHTYNVFITYTKSTGTFTSYIVDVNNGVASVSLCGTLATGNTGIYIACLCVKNIEAGSWVASDYLKGIDLYNYAMTEQEIATATNSTVNS